MSISLFSIPKSFNDLTRVPQNNAIASWLALPNSPEIFLCGDDLGVAQAAHIFGAQHLSGIECTSQGTPLLSDTFAKVHAQARHRILMYVNADIILLPDFVPAVEQVAQEYAQFLMLGRRWNLDVKMPVDFGQAGWAAKLREQVQQYGIFSGVGALDYFVFPKPLFTKLPPFAVGRAGWDNWMVGEAIKQDYAIVNSSQVVTAIHQNHDYTHLPGKRLEAFHGKEAQHNRTFLKNHFAGSSANATHVLPQHEGSPRVSILLSHDTKTAKKEPKTALGEAMIALQEQTYKDFEIVSSNKYEESDYSLIALWNYALTEAKGEFVLFLDTQTRLLPNALTEWMAKIDSCGGSLEMVFAGWERKSRPAVFSPRERGVANEERANMDKSACMIEPWHHLAELLGGKEGVQGFHIWALPQIWDLFHPSSVLFRRDWLVRFGGLRELHQPKSALIDLVLRLSSRGAAAVYLEAPVLRCGKDSLDETFDLIDEDCRQILNHYFQQKHLPQWGYALQSHAYQVIETWLGKQNYLIAPASSVSSGGISIDAVSAARKASPQFL